MKTISGGFKNPDGTAVANGILKLRLSQAANISGTAQIAPTEVIINLNASGAIPASTQIYANDELTPSGTTYYAALFNGNLGADGVTYQAGGQIFNQQWSITGTTPIDLTTLTPTTSGASFPSPLSSVGLTMPGEFSVAGSPLTTNGTIAVTKANENANTVWAGPTSGGAATPAFRALVDADIPASMANHSMTGTDSGTQTLKNKTLNGAGNGNALTLLAFSQTGGTLTGNSTDQALYTFAIPAGAIGAGKGIRIHFHINDAGGISYAMKVGLGGTLVQVFTGQTAVNIAGELFLYNNPGVTNAQTLYAGVVTSGVGTLVVVPSLGALGTYAKDTTASQNLTLTFNAASGSFNLVHAWVELLS